ncbi:MAG: glycosyltransferase, partial [Rubrivivax sp.]|nr:glycosyltransferase [Rubrivivax sp.]
MRSLSSAPPPPRHVSRPDPQARGCHRRSPLSPPTSAEPAPSVLHVGKFFPPAHGGIESFLAELIAAQRSLGADAAAVVHGTPRADDPPWLVRVQVQVQLVYAPIALGFRAALARAIAQACPDVLHLHLPNTSAFWALTLPAARQLPWVVHWHADVVATRGPAALRAAYRLYRPFEQAVLERASHIVVTSPPYLEASEALRPWHDKCSVVPLAIRPAVDGTPPPSAVGRPMRLLAIGRLAHYKGFDTLIQAAADTPGVELRIVGDGEMRAELEALIRRLADAGCTSEVHLLGSVDDATKDQLLRDCDVLCLPSVERTEAFGVVLLEAMRHARPCIASDLPGSG